MSLLNDAELVKQLRGQHPIVRDFPTEVAKEFERDPLGPKSPAQPSSIDLHIGQIYLPGASQGKAVPHKEWQLSPGHSLIVVTHEVLDIPPNVGAAAFPLAGRGQRGLLMMNPGHIDPGYEGVLWFSLINLSRDVVSLSQGDHIATVLFWNTCAVSERPWKGRRGPEVHKTAPAEAIESIAGDALMLEARATQAAARIVADHMTEVRSEVTELKNELLIDLEKQKGYVNAEFKSKAGWVTTSAIALPIRR